MATKNKLQILSSQKGYGLTLILMVMLAVSLAISIVGYNMLISTTNRTFGQADYDRTKSVSKGLGEITRAIISGYYAVATKPNSDDLQQILETELPKYLPIVAPGSPVYLITKVQVSTPEIRPQALLSYSAFQGLNASQSVFQVDVTVERISGALAGDRMVTNMHLALSVASLSIFSFLEGNLVSNYNYSGFVRAVFDGRVHSNYNICLGSQSDWDPQIFDKITAAGKILMNNNSECLNSPARIEQIYVNIDDQFNPPAASDPIDPAVFPQLTKDGVHGCTDCEGTKLSWAKFAQTKFKGSVADSALGVQKLILPGMQLLANTQPGMNEKVTDPAKSNADTMRVVVDPVLPGDSVPVKEQKLAYKSDIRIIDGVWYLRDPANPGNWPGKPIWSDHPGNYSENGIAVGQSDIRILAGNWPAGKTPKLFSLYRFKTGYGISDTDAEDTQGVISYGGLKKIAAPTADEPWVPAHWVDSKASGASLCPSSSVQTCGTACGFIDVYAQQNNATKLVCNAGSPQPTLGTTYLNATRTGFINPRVRYGSKPDPAATLPNCAEPVNDTVRYKHSRMLPVNFNVRQFTEAMKSNLPGELGSYFSNARPFNGIVYISMKWPGSDQGYGGAAYVQSHPPQGDTNDAGQAASTSINAQQALPFPLCSNSEKGNSFDGPGLFKVPDCDKYDDAAPGKILAFPNMVRIYNGKNLDKDVFPKGLTISTNMPASLLGDYNSSSNPTSASSTPWIPAMIASDSLLPISNNWTDELAAWTFEKNTAQHYCSDGSYALNPAYIPRPALTTKIVASILTSNRLNEAEDWSGQERIFHGSYIIGFYNVFLPSEAPVSNDGPNGYSIWIYQLPAQRGFYFDKHLQFQTPPGTPTVPVVGALSNSVE